MIWLVVRDNKVRLMEHEGDYEDEDLLVQVTAERGNPVVRFVVPEKETDG